MLNFYWLSAQPSLLLLRDFKCLGGWEGAPEDGIKMAGVGAGEASVD